MQHQLVIRAIGAKALIQSARALATAPLSHKKIKVVNPVVDLDGDEMTRIIWAEIKKKVNFNAFFVFFIQL